MGGRDTRRPLCFEDRPFPARRNRLNLQGKSG